MTQDVPTRQPQLNPRLLLALLTPQTWAIVILGTLVAVTFVPQWLKGSPTEAAPTTQRKLTEAEKQQAWDALIDAEARRLNAEAQRQILIPNSDCRGQDKACVLNRFQREASDQLRQTLATTPAIAASNYFRLEAIERARTLGGVSNTAPIERYLQGQQ